MEDRRRAGRALDDHFPGAIIASTARARNLVLVTRNISEFEDTGLKLIDPWTTWLRKAWFLADGFFKKAIYEKYKF